MKTTIVKLSGLTCTACTKLIAKRIKTIADVEDVNVELPGKATIQAGRDIIVDEIQKVLEGTQYQII